MTGVECDCPARFLDPRLVGQHCGVCGGIFPPFTPTDLLIIAAARRHIQERWKEDHDRWNGQRD